MRAIDPELQARLDSGATRLCRCWRVRRQDGTVYGFTDHDRDLTWDGETYRASTGMDASAVQSTTGLSVDNAQAVGALSDTTISEDEIRAGKFDKAEVDHWLVDWARPSLRVLLFRGHFGEIRRSDGMFEVELRGLAEALNLPVGRSILRTCDRVLGDKECRVDVTRSGFSGEAEVSEVKGAAHILSVGLGRFPDGWFAGGTLTWLSGANAGERGTTKADTRASAGIRVLEMWLQPAWPVVVGDRFRVVAGCDKRPETCRIKFDNFLNFRGFPHIPGEDWVTAYPKDGAVHDGASRQRS